MDNHEEEKEPLIGGSELNAGLERIDASMVKRLAEQTTLNLWPGWVHEGRGLINLIAFAKAVAAFEREQCAEAIRKRSNAEVSHSRPTETP